MLKFKCGLLAGTMGGGFDPGAADIMTKPALSRDAGSMIYAYGS